MKEGNIIFMVIRGPSGESLYIGDETGAFRLDGPKPWGGGDLIHKFIVDVKELRRELDRYRVNASSSQKSEPIEPAVS